MAWSHAIVSNTKNIKMLADLDFLWLAVVTKTDPPLASDFLPP
jgi:hypothetical protein